MFFAMSENVNHVEYLQGRHSGLLEVGNLGIFSQIALLRSQPYLHASFRYAGDINCKVFITDES